MKPSEIKNVLITGASQGIGRSLAFESAKHGWRLALLARNIEQLENIAKEIISMGGKAIPIQCDVSGLDNMKQATETAHRLLGTIDLAILNAGVGLPDWFENYSSENIKKIFDVNVFGIANGIECILPYMKEHKWGFIAGVGSLAEARGFPGNGSYCASKAAVGNLLEAARIELKHIGIKIISIKPGFVKTNMTANNRFKMPFLIDAGEAAERIIEGILKGKSRISFPLPTAFFSYIGKMVPGAIYEWVMSFLKKPIIG